MALIEAAEQTGQTHAAQAPVQTEQPAQPPADPAGWTDQQRQTTWTEQQQLQRQTDWADQRAERDRQAARLTALYKVISLIESRD